jgi:streptogramin lyase
MKYVLFLITFLVILFIPEISYSLTKTGWTQYCSSQKNVCAASQGEICWVGSYGNGLFRINLRTGDTIYFTNINSDLPSNFVNSIAIGASNLVWIATTAGLASFDGNSWQVFHSGNTPFASNDIKSIDLDDEGSVWVSYLAVSIALKITNGSILLRNIPIFRWNYCPEQQNLPVLDLKFGCNSTIVLSASIM